MKIFLIGNYPVDKQESMNRFSEWLKKAVHVRGWQVADTKPQCLIGYLAFNSSFLQKWFGYIDKFVLYPIWLFCLSHLHYRSIFHIVDHSNAFYGKFIPKNNCVLTCHDVLAIRGGIGDKEAYCPASRFGTVFQKWILRNLQQVPHIVFVSNSTLTDYQSLPGRPNKDQVLEVIYNGLNAQFEKTVMDAENTPYFFHIGSQLPRKNRIGILKAFFQFNKHHTDHKLRFAGRPFSKEETDTIRMLDLPEDSIQHLGKVTHERLIQLYRNSQALVFPSFSEGFGWPVIEAQALECPVICSNKTSLPEIAGKGALLCDPNNLESIHNAMEQTQIPEIRSTLIEEGLKNIQRFSEEETAHKYLALYQGKSS